MNCYIVGIRHGHRHAVCAVLAEDEERAKQKTLGRNTGWEIEFVKPKTDETVFRIYDSGWYYDEENAAPIPRQPLERFQHYEPPSYRQRCSKCDRTFMPDGMFPDRMGRKICRNCATRISAA